MSDASKVQTINDYWGRDGLGQAILDALAESGKDLDALTIDDLAPFDQFHLGGKESTMGLGRLAELTPGQQVLDVGGGLGGPARTLAVEFGCAVTVIDLTESYVLAANELTAQLELGDRVKHQTGNGLELPFDERQFDVVWTQNSGMNIATKELLYAGFHRVLRPGGRLVFQEPMAGAVQPLIFPVMWARDASMSYLRTPSEMRAVIEGAGFRTHIWEDMKPAKPSSIATGSPFPIQGIQKLIMAEDLAAIAASNVRNRDEERMISVRAVLDRM